MKTPKNTGKLARDKIHAENDPYMPKKGLTDFSLCKDCTAVYHNKKWHFDEKLYEEKKSLKDVNWVQCPACKKIKENVPNGVVTLRGEFLKEHKQEIINLINNEDARSKSYNPLKRIMKLDDNGDKIEIFTTSKNLAQRIGTIMHKAYGGEVEYKKDEDPKFTRVEWVR